MNHLNCGKIIEGPKINIVEYVVSKLSDINNTLIPFFSSYPLQGLKALNSIDFCQVAKLMVDKAHLNNEGVNKVMLIKKGMNYGRN